MIELIGFLTCNVPGVVKDAGNGVLVSGDVIGPDALVGYSAVSGYSLSFPRFKPADWRRGRGMTFFDNAFYRARHASVFLISDSMLRGVLHRSLKTSPSIASVTPSVVTALGGAKVRDILDKLTSLRAGEEVYNFECKLFVLVGTNDSHSDCFNLTRFEDDFKRLLTLLISIFPRGKVYLMSLAPRFVTQSEKCKRHRTCMFCAFIRNHGLQYLINNRIVPLNQLIRSTAGALGFEFIDLFNLLIPARQFIGDDGLHLSEVGIEMVDQIIRGYV